MKCIRFLKGNNGISLLVFIFLLANLFFIFFYKDIWWDSAVYIGMGKYIYSLGESGLWESSRPLMLPLFIGVGNLFDFNPVLFAKIISVLFSSFALIMVYFIGLKLSSKRTGIMAAFFLAFSYTYFFFSSNILTAIPSVFFMLLAFYFFMDEKFFLAGIFSGASLMTRFFQAFVLLGFLIVFIIWHRENIFRKLAYFAFGIVIAIIPFMILNYVLYGYMLFPFKVQASLSGTTGWNNYNPPWFYFTGLLKENFLLLFLLAAPFVLRKKSKLNALFIMPLAYILIFSLIRQKEMRFMLLVLPFLYILLALSLEGIYMRIKNKLAAAEIFYVMCGIFLFITFMHVNGVAAYQLQPENDGFLYFQEYIHDKTGNIWITNPVYGVYSDAKLELLYYKPPFELLRFLEQNDAEIVLFNECDIPCPPVNSNECLQGRKALSEKLSKMKNAYENEINSCKYQIFTS